MQEGRKGDRSNWLKSDKTAGPLQGHCIPMTMAGTAAKRNALLLNDLKLEPWKPVGDKTMAMSWRGLEYKCASAHLGALMQTKCPVSPRQNKTREKMDFHY